MGVEGLVQGAFWTAIGLAAAGGQVWMSVKRRRALNGAGRAQGTVAEIVKRGRRGLDLHPVIEFVASDGERVVFEDEMGVGKYDHGREFEVAYDPADPWGTAVAVRKGRWFWSSLVGWLFCTVFLIAGIAVLVHGIIGHKRG